MAVVTGLDLDSIEVQNIRYEIKEKCVYLMILPLEYPEITGWSHYIGHEYLFIHMNLEPNGHTTFII